MAVRMVSTTAVALLVFCRGAVASSDDDSDQRHMSTVMRAEIDPLEVERDETETAFMEVSSDGSIKESISDAQYPQRAAYGPVPVAPADLKEASAYCGSPRFVSTCGPQTWAPSCFTNAITGKQECVRGMCVCTSPQGCVDPVCTTEACSLGVAAECANGVSCISKPGTGWQCWHPCNAIHAVSDYGTTQGSQVNLMRGQGSCAAYGIQGQSHGAPQHAAYAAPGAGAASTEAPLNGGLDLSYQQYPVFGGQVKADATKNGAWHADVAHVFFLTAIATLRL